MHREKGFYLVDCLAALALVLLGSAAIAGLATRSERFLRIWWERQVALEIVANIRTLPTVYWELGPERSFDFRGLPVEGPGKYRLALDILEESGIRSYLATLTYRDEEGKDHSLEIRRLEWRPGHEGF